MDTRPVITVGELIDELYKLPHDTDIYICVNDGSGETIPLGSPNFFNYIPEKKWVMMEFDPPDCFIQR